MKRGLLSLVLLLTVLLLIQRLVFPFDGSNRHTTELDAEQGRYEFQFLGTNHGPLLLKVETTTGAVWKRDLEKEGPWTRLNDEVVLADDPAAESPRKRKRRKRRPRMDPKAVTELVAEIGRVRGIDVANLPEDLSLLIQIVRTGQPEELRGWAIGQIAGYPAKDAVPAFVELLDHSDRSVLIRVVEGLEKENDRAAIEPLRRLLESDPEPSVENAASRAIAALEAEASKPVD
jgi:hypothetical protein